MIPAARVRRWVPLALLLLTSCGPRRVRWRPTEPTGGAGPRAYAVVWAGAPFHVAPDANAATVPLMPPSRAREPWARDTFIAFRVVGEAGGWTTVETLGGDGEAHCTAERPFLSPFHLRLHVPSRSLVPVTVREVTQTFDDGTSVRLARGVPLESVDRRQLYRARLGQLSTVVRLDRRDVGTRYLPSDLPRAAPVQGRLSMDALRAGAPILGRTGRVHSTETSGDVAVHARERRGGEEIVELRPRCARLSVRVPAHVVSEPMGAIGGIVPGPSDAPPYVEPGTRIFWRDGRDAGIITRRVTAGDEVGAAGDLRCFARALHRDAEPSVVLCFERAAVVTPGRNAAGSLSSPGE